MIRDHLALAEEHVAKGERIVARQKDLVAELENDGHDTKEARSVLCQFEQVLQSHIADRDRLRDELAGVKSE